MDWPKSGQAVTGRLKRLTPALAAEGVAVHIPKERGKGGRIITLEDRRESLPPLPPSPPEPDSAG